jgi:hypothetical protein
MTNSNTIGCPCETGLGFGSGKWWQLENMEDPKKEKAEYQRQKVRRINGLQWKG